MRSCPSRAAAPSPSIQRQAGQPVTLAFLAGPRPRKQYHASPLPPMPPTAPAKALGLLELRTPARCSPYAPYLRPCHCDRTTHRPPPSQCHRVPISLCGQYLLLGRHACRVYPLQDAAPDSPANSSLASLAEEAQMVAVALASLDPADLAASSATQQLQRQLEGLASLGRPPGGAPAAAAGREEEEQEAEEQNGWVEEANGHAVGREVRAAEMELVMQMYANGVPGACGQLDGGRR